MPRFILAAVLCLSTAAPAPAQTARLDYLKSTLGVDVKKLWYCNSIADQLVGITEANLKEVCGGPLRRNLSVSAHGRWEQWAYTSTSDYVVMYVYLTNGIVTSVQSLKTTSYAR